MIKKILNYFGFVPKQTYMMRVNGSLVFMGNNCFDAYDYDGNVIPIAEAAIWNYPVNRDEVAKSLNKAIMNTGPEHWWVMGEEDLSMLDLPVDEQQKKIFKG